MPTRIIIEKTNPKFIAAVKAEKVANKKKLQEVLSNVKPELISKLKKMNAK